MSNFNIEDYYEKDFGVAFVKTNGNRIKVTLSFFKNNFYVHIREYSYDGDEDRWYPTKSGYAIQAEGLENIVELLEQASEEYNSLVKEYSQLELSLEG